MYRRFDRIRKFWGYNIISGYGKPSIKTCRNPYRNPGYGNFPGYGRFSGFGSSTSHIVYRKTIGGEGDILIESKFIYDRYGRLGLASITEARKRIVYRIFDYTKGLISHNIYITGSFKKKRFINGIWLNEGITDKVIVVWILSDLFFNLQ